MIWRRSLILRVNVLVGGAVFFLPFATLPAVVLVTAKGFFRLPVAGPLPFFEECSFVACFLLRLSRWRASIPWLDVENRSN